LKTLNWTPAPGFRHSGTSFAGETNIRKAWFFVVIPAEAGMTKRRKFISLCIEVAGQFSAKISDFKGGNSDEFHEDLTGGG
jgi:hypothetical protein